MINIGGENFVTKGTNSDANGLRLLSQNQYLSAAAPESYMID